MCEDERLMDQALAEAREAARRGDTPVAALVVMKGRVVGIGSNRVRSRGDPTAHAEVEALRAACAAVGERVLEGHTCYTTMEPCPMCCWALLEGGLGRLVLGARHRKLGRRDYGDYSVELLWEMTGQRPVLTEGVREVECESIRRGWMRASGRES